MYDAEKIGLRIKYARERKEMSVKDLGDKLGLSGATISRYENGVVAKIKLPILESIADELDVNELWLIGKSDDMSPPIDQYKRSSRIPLLGQIAAGAPILAEENIEDYISLDSRFKADFCLRVKGDSMIDEGIYPEDIVFIKKQDDVDNGEIGAVVIDGEATLKRVHKENGSLILQPANKNYKPMFFTSGDVRIAGKLVAVLNIRD